jgi:hypothetical protein
MIVVPCSSETTVLTKAKLCHMSEDEILHTHHREYLKSYIK